MIEGPNARDQIVFCALNSFLVEVQTKLACFRLSDGGEDAKVKGTRKVGGAGRGGLVFTRFFFSCSRFLNSADPTISEPGTGKTKLATYVSYMCNSKPVIRIVGASCPPKLITLMLYYF